MAVSTIPFSSSEEKFSALFDFATEGIIVINSDGIIVLSNPASERLFGYRENELIGKPVEMLIPKRFGEHTHHREKYADNPRPRSMGIGMNLYGKKKNGEEIPVEISLSPYRSGQSHLVIAFIIDITVRKKSEEIQKKQKEELELLYEIFNFHIIENIQYDNLICSERKYRPNHIDEDTFQGRPVIQEIIYGWI